MRFHGDVEPGFAPTPRGPVECTIATLSGASAILDASVREGWFADACLARGGRPGVECRLGASAAMFGTNPRWRESALRVADEAGAPADAPVAYVEIGGLEQAFTFILVFTRGAWRVIYAERAWTT